MQDGCPEFVDDPEPRPSATRRAGDDAGGGWAGGVLEPETRREGETVVMEPLENRPEMRIPVRVDPRRTVSPELDDTVWDDKERFLPVRKPLSRFPLAR